MADEEIQHTSESALLTAGWRAMESSRSDALFHDPLAAGLAGERGLRIARTRPEGAWVVAIRTVLIDAFVRSAISSGIDTVINLGAGLDTRPYRMDLPSSLHWIEVDHPSLIEGKTAHLSSEVPACSIERVGLDLTDGDARRELFDWIWTTSKARASDSDLPSATRCSPKAVRGRLSGPSARVAAVRPSGLDRRRVDVAPEAGGDQHAGVVTGSRAEGEDRVARVRPHGMRDARRIRRRAPSSPP